MAAGAAVSSAPVGDAVIVSNTASAAQQCVATLVGVGGRRHTLTGFTVTVGIAASAVTTTFTIAGLVGGANIVYEIAESTTQGAQLTVIFPVAIPAASVGAAITGTVAAIASGGVPSVVLYGDLV